MKGISRCIIHSLKRTMKNLTQNYFYLSRIHGLDSLSLLQGHPPNPGIEPRSPTLQADSLPVEPPEKPRDNSSVQFSHSVVSDSLPTPWITAHQASLSITNSQSSPRLTSIKSEMPSSHLILCHPLLLLPPIPPSIRVFSNESTLRMR